MTDLKPDLIERAAKALWDEPGWDRALHEQRLHHREAAERALSAVLPDIIRQAKAEALREAATKRTDWQAIFCRFKRPVTSEDRAFARGYDAALFDIIQQAKEEAWDEGAHTAWERSTPEVNGARYHWRSDGEPVNPYENGGQQ